MKFDQHPLHPGQIQPADELYRVDVSEQTQERLRSRSQRALPTMGTTTGRPEWRWGRPTDGPTSSSAPRIFSPSDLVKQRSSEAPDRPSIRDVVARLRP
jgi:hypothetical protein